MTYHPPDCSQLGRVKGFGISKVHHCLLQTQKMSNGSLDVRLWFYTKRGNSINTEAANPSNETAYTKMIDWSDLSVKIKCYDVSFVEIRQNAMQAWGGFSFFPFQV